MSPEIAKLRAFIAILPNHAFLEAAEQQMAQLKKAAPWQNLLWHNLENLHITLHHLGNIKVNDLELLRQIKKICSQFSPFTVHFDSLCYFPDAPPKVLAVKVQDNENLQKLALTLQTQLKATKIQFSAHVTLGRLSAESLSLPALPSLDNLPSFTTKSCFLLESQRQNGASVYIPLAKFKFMQ